MANEDTNSKLKEWLGKYDPLSLKEINIVEECEDGLYLAGKLYSHFNFLLQDLIDELIHYGYEEYKHTCISFKLPRGIIHVDLDDFVALCNTDDDDVIDWHGIPNPFTPQNGEDFDKIIDAVDRYNERIHEAEGFIARNFN